MATGGLYGSSGTGALIAQPGSESSGLYGNSTSFGGTYFEWFVFQTSETQPATPTGGTWNFTTNANTPPTGWSSAPPSNPLNTVWVSIAIVNSKNTAALVWSVPGKFAFSSGLPILSDNGAPEPADGQSDQLYIQLDTVPQTIWFKESGTWTRLTGSTLYADLTSNQTIAGTKTFSSQIQGSISGNASNVTGTVAITNGGTGSTTAGSARAALGVAASGANNDITSLSGLTTALSLVQGGTGATTASDARTNLGLGSAAVLTAGAANGVATLDAGGTVPLSQIPASIQGGVSYQGTWNATTNTPTLTSSVGTKGYYYVVSVAGSTNLNGITSWNIGDWAIFNGTAWEKIDNTDAVTSVAGRTGAVVLSNTDISGLGTMSTQNANAVNITGGSLDGVTIGSFTAGSGEFTALFAETGDFGSINLKGEMAFSGNAGVAGQVFTSAGDGELPTWETPTTGTVTSVSGTGTVSGLTLSGTVTTSGSLTLGGTLNLSSPPAIGGTAANTGAFTTLTTSGAVTHNAGTANGVAYLNGSKVLTTGSALTFDGNFELGIANTASSATNKLVLTGFNSFGNAYVLTGASSAANSLSLGTQTNIPVIFTLNGSEQMRLTSTGLGIGTSSPAYKLDIAGASYARMTTTTYVDGGFINARTALSNGTYNTFDFVEGSTTTAYLRNYGSAFGGSADNHLRLWNTQAAPITFGTSNTERMRLDSSGNLGLGVTPSAWVSSWKALDVTSGGSSLFGSLAIGGIATNCFFDSGATWRYKTSFGASRFEQSSNGSMAWHQAPTGTAGNAISFTQAMSLTAGGNLLVGTTSGDARVKIQAPAGTTMLHATDGTRGDFFIDFPSIQVTRLTAEYGADGILAFATGTSKTERARIDSSGNLLVGTTSSFGGAKVCVSASTSFATRGTASSDAGNWSMYRADTGAKAWEIATNAINFYIADDNFSNYAYLSQNPTAWQFGSDRRIKTDIVQLDYGLDAVMAMQPKRYRFIETGRVDIGFIAQELRSVVPEAVSGNEVEFLDTDTPQERANKTLGVGKETLIPVLVKAIQEQQALITALTARITALESN